MAILWPFTMAYLRGWISSERLTRAFGHVLGELGVALAARVSNAVVLGRMFAWYLWARGVMALTRATAARAARDEGPVRGLVWTGSPAPGDRGRFRVALQPVQQVVEPARRAATVPQAAIEVHPP